MGEYRAHDFRCQVFFGLCGARRQARHAGFTNFYFILIAKIKHCGEGLIGGNCSFHEHDKKKIFVHFVEVFPGSTIGKLGDRTVISHDIPCSTQVFRSFRKPSSRHSRNARGGRCHRATPPLASPSLGGFLPLLKRLAETREGSAYRLFGDAEGEAEITGIAEARAGHRKYIVLL